MKARNSWVRCAFDNLLNIQDLSPWQRGHGYSRPSQRLVKVLWRTAGREFDLQREHFAERTCKLFADRTCKDFADRTCKLFAGRTCKLFARRTCKHFAEETSKELVLNSFVLSCFVVIVKVDVQFSPTNIRLLWKGSFLLPKGWTLWLIHLDMKCILEEAHLSRQRSLPPLPLPGPPSVKPIERYSPRNYGSIPIEKLH